MEKTSDGAVLFDPDGLRVHSITPEGDTIAIGVGAARPQAACPRCGKPSQAVHSRYVRKVKDLPWHGRSVVWKVHGRRFFCREKGCEQKVFTERLPGVGAQARRTNRLSATLTDIAFALGGEAGARMARSVGMPTSPDTLLRLLQAEPLPEGDPPKHLGIDDWAIRKRELYGTILVDLDTHRPVDLLPGRDADSVRQWLQDHPGVEVITRDRAGAYAEAARLGAPDAVQVADRWHLARNLGAALERLALRHYREIRQVLQSAEEPRTSSTAPTLPESGPPDRVPLTPRQRQERQARHARKEGLVEQARRFHDCGVSVRETARRLGLDRKTARRYITRGAPPCVRRRPSSQLDPYKPYLVQRWEEGCRSAAQLLREIKAQGYPGHRTMVKLWLSQLRSSLPPRVRRRMPSARSLAWALTTPSLAAGLESAVVGVPDLAQARLLSLAFLSMLRDRSGEKLDDWLISVDRAGIRELEDFASGLRKDLDAVRAGLTLSWSQGQVEGHIHRLKLLKRQMYGRCSFETLRRRVLRAG